MFDQRKAGGEKSIVALEVPTSRAEKCSWTLAKNAVPASIRRAGEHQGEIVGSRGPTAREARKDREKTEERRRLVDGIDGGRQDRQRARTEEGDEGVEAPGSTEEQSERDARESRC